MSSTRRRSMEALTTSTSTASPTRKARPVPRSTMAWWVRSSSKAPGRSSARTIPSTKKGVSSTKRPGSATAATVPGKRSPTLSFMKRAA